MRTREEIVEGLASIALLTEGEQRLFFAISAKLQLEVLLDIRELLTEMAVCGHGNRGWCVWCAIAIHNGTTGHIG